MIDCNLACQNWYGDYFPYLIVAMAWGIAACAFLVWLNHKDHQRSAARTESMRQYREKIAAENDDFEARFRQSHD